MSKFGISKIILIIVAFSVATLTGCTKSEDYLAEQAINHSHLIDPTDLLFRDLSKDTKRNAICGQVNAKTRAGSRSGWNDFYLYKNDDGEVSFGLANNQLGSFLRDSYCSNTRALGETMMPWDKL